jgi:3'(2'), 5'-bisphosphate nucleotidase
MGYDREVELAIEAVCEAAQLCVAVRESMVTALEKDDRSPVTVADFGSQALVCRRLKMAFSDDPIVGEEDASALREPEQVEMRKTVCRFVNAYVSVDEETVCKWIDEGNGDVPERFWTLDPIDGTKGFLRGDQYVVALALIDRGKVQVAAIACPALPVDIDQLDGDCGMLFVAVRGGGTKAMPLSGGEMVDVRVADAGNAKAWRFAESVEASHGDHDAQGAVARGAAALYLRLPSPKYPDYREKIWDHAAGSLIVEEAGGRVTDMYGKPLDFATDVLMEDNRGVIVSAGEIHDDVINALNGI